MVRITARDRQPARRPGPAASRSEPSTSHGHRSSGSRRHPLGRTPARIVERCPDRVGEPDRDDLDAGHVGGRRARRRAARSPGGSPGGPPHGGAAPGRRHARSSPRSPTSPMATVPGTSGRSRQRGGEGERERQVERRLRDRQAPGQVGVHVVLPRPMPARRPRTATSRASRLGSTPDAVRRGGPMPAGRDQGLDLDEQRARCPPGRPRRRCRARAPRARARKARAGSATSRRPRSPISNTPTSSVEPKRFLVARSRRRPPVRSPSEPTARRRPGARASWAGQRAVLGHVAHEDDRDALALGQLHQPQRCLADLADAARRPVELRRRSSGLHRVDHEQAGRGRAGGLERCRPTPVSAMTRIAVAGGPVAEAEALARRRTWPPTPRRWRRGPVPHRPGAAMPAAACSSRVDLPMPGSPPSSTSEPATRPPPRTRSSSPIPTGGGAPARRRPPSGTAGAARRPGPAPRADGPGSSRTTVSTSVFQSPQVRHWPSQRRTDAPQDWQTKRLSGRATGDGRTRRLRPASSPRRP